VNEPLGAASATTPAVPVPVPAGTVYDLGYKRYLGTRLPQGMRWRVIMRQQLGSAWKTWWRFKLSMVSAIIATLVAGAIMYVASDTVMQLLRRGDGGGANPVGQMALRFIDGILPLSVIWYCKIGFIASMTVAASVVATDVRTGAFTFYFARSVRPLDYVLGKAAGLALLAGLLTFAGPVLLALLRVGLSDSTSQITAQLRGVGYAGIVGLLGTALYSIVPLGFSALVADRRWAVGLWALYYVAFGSIMTGLGFAVWGPLAALDLPGALSRISYALFDVVLTARGAPHFSIAWDIGSIAAHTIAALALVWWRVDKSARDGVGGMS
jgi:hypothetical protein